ncbi:MAG: iron-containing alcohol dehydrogenase [Spirochaetes bacterium]|nr:iron-containing alcohol dehydrogenase [Spirochaetota bacterium]
MKSFQSPAFYEFYSPVKILSGDNALDNIPYELSKKNSSNPLIITDEGVSKSGILKIVTKILKSGKIKNNVIFDKTPRDSSLEVVQELAAVFKKNKCDCIIAIGGGSVIDTAKGVRILVTNRTNNLKSLSGVNRINPSSVALFILPTTSGTGSEATQVAVISDNQKGEKMLFVSPYIYPDMAVLDPRLTVTLPPKLTAMTGMDALTHAVEAYTCTQKNPVSDAFASTAVKMVFSNLMSAVKNGSNKKARMELANASLLAGIAFSNSMVGAVHSIGHACGAVAHIPHGHAMSVILPEIMKYNFKKSSALYGELLLYAAGAEVYAATPEKERGTKLIGFINTMKSELEKKCGLSMLLPSDIFDAKMIKSVAEYAINDGSMLNNPLEMTVAQVEKVLKNCVAK